MAGTTVDYELSRTEGFVNVWLSSGRRTGGPIPGLGCGRATLSGGRYGRCQPQGPPFREFPVRLENATAHSNFGGTAERLVYLTMATDLSSPLEDNRGGFRFLTVPPRRPHRGIVWPRRVCDR